MNFNREQFFRLNHLSESSNTQLREYLRWHNRLKAEADAKSRVGDFERGTEC